MTPALLTTIALCVAEPAAPPADAVTSRTLETGMTERQVARVLGWADLELELALCPGWRYPRATRELPFPFSGLELTAEFDLDWEALREKRDDIYRLATWRFASRRTPAAAVFE